MGYVLGTKIRDKIKIKGGQMTKQKIKEVSTKELAVRFFYLLFMSDCGDNEAGVDLIELTDIDKEARVSTVYHLIDPFPYYLKDSHQGSLRLRVKIQLGFFNGKNCTSVVCFTFIFLGMGKLSISS